MNYIYKYTNKINGKIYVGITYDIALRKKSHKNGRKSVISRAIKKYGESCFNFEILKEVEDRNAAYQHEIYFIDHFNSFTNGYNCTLGGEGCIGICGEQASGAKLSNDDAKFILKSKLSNIKISKMFGISPTTIMNLRQRTTWKFLPTTLPNSGYDNDSIKYDEIIKENIVNDCCSNREAAVKYDICASIVSKFRKNSPIKYNKEWAKLDDTVVSDILSDACPNIVAAKKYGVSYSSVKNIRKRSSAVYDNAVYTSGLSSDDLNLIIKSTLSHAIIADKYDISITTVIKIRDGRLYAGLDRSTAPKYMSGRTKLTPEIVRVIYSDAGSVIEIAKKFSISYGCVYKIKKGIRWNNITKHSTAAI